MAAKAFKADDIKIVSGSNSRINKIVVNLSKNNKFGKLIYIPTIETIKKSTFLILKLKKLLTIYD